MIQLGEYPKHNRVFILLKELLIVQRYLKRTSDEDLIQLPKMTDISKDYALAFTRGLAIQAFFCDNLIEFLLASVRALRITFKYGLSGYSAVAIIAYGLVRYRQRSFLIFITGHLLPSPRFANDSSRDPSSFLL